MAGVLLNDLADQTIVVEALAPEQSGETYLAVFGDFMTAADTTTLPRPRGLLHSVASSRLLIR